MADRRRVLGLAAGAAGGLLLGPAVSTAEQGAQYPQAPQDPQSPQSPQDSQLLASRLDTSHGPVDFQLYLPAGYATSGETRYPLLLLLHGRGDRMAAWTRVRPMLDRLIREGRIPPLIAVLPDAPWSRRGSYYVDSAHEAGSPVETLLMRELLPHVDARWRTCREREARVVGGYSMGGYGALRYALAWPAQFAAALVLSPAVYTPLPPQGSSAREFGGFGRGPALFVDAIYREHNYPALVAEAAQRHSDLPLCLFIAAGDQEYKNPDPAEALHDIDMEAHLLFSRLSRTPHVQTALRILDGGHDWLVWEPAFHEGLLWAAQRLGWRASAGSEDATKAVV